MKDRLLFGVVLSQEVLHFLILGLRQLLMAKTHPKTLSGSIDALESNVESVRAADTAYTVDNAADYDAKRTIEPRDKRIHNFERDILLSALKKVPKDAKVLEVGCGTGRLLSEGLAAGYHVDGVDASGPMLEHLKAKLTEEQRQHVNLIVAEAADIPKPDASYDFAYTIRLLNQTESPEYALTVVDEIARLVKTGGYFLIEFVNEARPRIGTARRPTTRLRPSEVARRGEAAGGEVITHIGAYWLSMQAYKKCPNPLLGLLSTADRVLSKLLPRSCARSYVFFRKTGSAE